MPAPSEAVSLRRTPLFDVHREPGAKLIDFGGWKMPVQYEGILEEHRAVRERAGLFDVSQWGRPIGLALLPLAASAVGTELEIEIRGRAAKARVVETPFYLSKKEVPS